VDSTSVTSKYDPFGRRIEKSSSTATSVFAYDGDNLVETVNSSGGVVARYTQGENIDEPLAMQRGTTTSFYEADGLGLITSLSNTSGALAQTYTYDSFGNQTASSGSLTNFFRYTAREFDTETNLYYNRARYLDPATGRFISEDPIGFDGGVNFYDYVADDPINYLDPSGEIDYNKPPPITVPVTGKTLQALQCLEHCLQCVTNNPNLNLLVTGGAEQSGHSKHSYHHLGLAVDISFYNAPTMQWSLDEQERRRPTSR